MTQETLAYITDFRIRQASGDTSETLAIMSENMTAEFPHPICYINGATSTTALSGTIFEETILNYIGVCGFVPHKADPADRFEEDTSEHSGSDCNDEGSRPPMDVARIQRPSSEWVPTSCNHNTR